MEASVDWSHDLLTDLERTAFRRLSVFAGGFSFEAAEDVSASGVIERHQVLDLLSLLIDQSLVVVDDDGNRSRYRLLETIRYYYAARRLAEADEEVETRTRHRDYYLALAEEAEPHLEGRGQVDWMGRVPGLADCGTAPRGARTGRAASRLDADGGSRWACSWDLTDAVRPPKASFGWSAALAQDAVSPAVRAKALYRRNSMAHVNFDLDTAIAHAEEGLVLAQHVGDDRLTSRLLCSLGSALIWTDGDPDAAARGGGRHSPRRAHDTFILAEGLLAHGVLHVNHDTGRARSYLEESIRVAEDVGNRLTTDFALALNGLASTYEGDLRDARSILEGVLERSSEILYGMAVTFAAGLLATVLVDMAENADALAAADRLDVFALETGARSWDLYAPLARGLVCASEGNHAEALRRFGAALTLAPLPEARATILAAVADTELAVGKINDARAHADEVVEISRSADFPTGFTQGLVLQARLRRMKRELADAEEIAHEALASSVDISAKLSVVAALEVLAGIATDLQNHQEAARLFGSAQGIRDRTGYARHCFESDRDIATSTQALGPVAFETVASECRALSLEAAVAYALRGRRERNRP